MLTVETLAQLGITKEELLTKIAETAVQQLLFGTSVDDEGVGYPVNTEFNREMKKLIEDGLRAKVDEYFRAAVLPQLVDISERLLLKRTSPFGEPKGRKMTLKEFMVHETRKYLRETVDTSGRPSTRANGKSRLQQLLTETMQEVLKLEAETIVGEANEILATELQGAVSERLTSLAEKFKIVVKP